MKLNLYEDKNNTDERVDVYYANMRPVIRQIIDTVNSERPSLQGRPADEDLDDGEEILLDPRDIYYLDHIDRKLFAYTKSGVFRVMNTLAAYEDGSCETLRIYDLLESCGLDTVIYMGTHDGYGEDPTSFDQVLEIMPSSELVIIDGADHFFEGEYGEMMVDDACAKIASW